jgi:hypothetical protein
VAGTSVALFGVVLLLATLDVIHLGFAVLAPVICAVAGAILLARGLARGD